MSKAIAHVAIALRANLRKMLTPLSFLRLRSPDLLLYQWLLPTIIAIPLYLFILNPEDRFSSFSFVQLIRDINSLVGILVGFYIAALAAVSTFSNPKLDEALKGLPTTIKRRIGKDVVTENVSRRRYLAIIFGYCAGVSVVLYIFGVFQANVTIPVTGEKWLFEFNNFVFGIFWFLYLWFLSSLLTATSIGLHYLVDRMHR